MRLRLRLFRLRLILNPDLWLSPLFNRVFGAQAKVWPQWLTVLVSSSTDFQVQKRTAALWLMTHPGVGPITALAYVLIIGTPEWFHVCKQIGTYLG